MSDKSTRCIVGCFKNWSQNDQRGTVRPWCRHMVEWGWLRAWCHQCQISRHCTGENSLIFKVFFKEHLREGGRQWHGENLTNNNISRGKDEARWILVHAHRRRVKEGATEGRGCSHHRDGSVNNNVERCTYSRHETNTLSVWTTHHQLRYIVKGRNQDV